jgi:hypothetical protein
MPDSPRRVLVFSLLTGVILAGRYNAPSRLFLDMLVRKTTATQKPTVNT